MADGMNYACDAVRKHKNLLLELLRRVSELANVTEQKDARHGRTLRIENEQVLSLSFL